MDEPDPLAIAGAQLIDFALDPFHTTTHKRALLARVREAIRNFEYNYDAVVE